MVYVISQDGSPLMPTNRHGKIRHLLKEKRAKVINRCPFTIQLTYQNTNYTQPITLGVDAGSKTIGLSATTEKRELYASEVILRTDIVELLSTRRETRRTRRNRKTRYRKARFHNRKVPKGWTAPSIRQKIESHLNVVKKVYQILPIRNTIVEVASFDIQKIKAIKDGKDIPSGVDYQKGDQLGFWNVREYVLWRDGHKCQNPKCKHGKILNVHHIESRKIGGDAPGNLITLCEECHQLYHKGKLKLKFKRVPSYRDAAFMGIMRWAFYNELKKRYPNVSLTYGYITKNIRITNKLPKMHVVDSRCISGHPTAIPLKEYLMQKKIRCHNRQLHKFKPAKNGIRKRQQAARYVKGFQLFDKVRFKGQECFIFGRRSSGYFDLRRLDGTKIHASASYKRLERLEHKKAYLIEICRKEYGDSSAA